MNFLQSNFGIAQLIFTLMKAIHIFIKHVLFYFQQLGFLIGPFNIASGKCIIFFLKSRLLRLEMSIIVRTHFQIGLIIVWKLTGDILNDS